MSARKLLIAAVATVLLSSAASADEGPDWRTETWARFFSAQVHIRYHHMAAHTYGSLDRIMRVSTLLLALVSLSGPYVFTLRKKWLKYVWWGIALVSTFASAALNIYPLNDWYHDHAMLAQRWTRLANDAERLRRDDKSGVVSQDELRIRFNQIADQQTAIETSEPAGLNAERMEAAYKDTLRRYPPDASDPASTGPDSDSDSATSHPGSFSEYLLGELLGIPGGRLVIFLIIAVLVIFAVWSTLPDPAKMKLINRITPRPNDAPKDEPKTGK